MQQRMPTDGDVTPFLQLFQNKLHCGDPLADEALASILSNQSHPSQDALQTIREAAAKGDRACRDFLEAIYEVPSWVDPDALAVGKDVFKRYSIFAMAIMVLGTLPRTYAPARSATVLIHTGRLHQDILRRLYETATMVDHILQADAPYPDSQGFQTIIRVRLMHAMVRRHVLNRQDAWPYPGQPISQLEMALVGSCFCVNLLDGLQRLGISLSDAECQAYQSLWRYANHLMGVDKDLLATSLDEEYDLYQKLSQILWQPNQQSRQLTSNLFDALHWQAPFYLPAPLLRALAVALLEPDLAVSLGVSSSAIWRLAVGALTSFNHVANFRNQLIPGCKRLETRYWGGYFTKVVRKGIGAQAATYRA